MMFAMKSQRMHISSLNWLLVVAGGLVLLMEAANATERVTYYHADGLGTPVMESDAAGTVTYKREHRPYGEQSLGTPKNGPGFTGHIGDADSGLIYMQQRYYDPVTGRLLSIDPEAINSINGANFNRYWYANSNPYRYVDPDGRQSCSDACLRMRAASDRVGGGIEGMTSWGIERVFNFVNKQANKISFTNIIGAITYFGSWAIPLQKKYGVEIGANLAKNNGRYMATDFHPGRDAGSVETWGYQGPGKWVGILHTHPSTANLSGDGVDARAITGHWDSGQAALRGVDVYVVKSNYMIQRLNYEAWMRYRDSNPGKPAYAGWFYEDL